MQHKVKSIFNQIFNHKSFNSPEELTEKRHSVKNPIKAANGQGVTGKRCRINVPPLMHLMCVCLWRIRNIRKLPYIKSKYCIGMVSSPTGRGSLGFKTGVSPWANLKMLRIEPRTFHIQACALPLSYDLSLISKERC